MNPEPTPEELPEALVDARRRLSLVWLVPLAALFAAGWLIYQANLERGPLVTIRFQNAEGLEAGKTRIRYKDVDVGFVEAVELSEDLTHVLVRARFDPGLEAHLTEDTRFWIVRPRFSGGQISGLSTLVGGVHIGVDLATAGRQTATFLGLDNPPVIESNTPGRSFALRTDSLGSLQIGSPVHYRGIEVGQVVSYRVDEGAGPIEVRVFIHEPHDTRINSGTRFWQDSGLDLTVGADGIKVDSESVATLLLGGVTFGSVPGMEEAEPVPEGTVFTLYPNRREAEDQRFTVKETWTLEFSGSVRGLSPGAPVEFRGIKVGEVKDIRLELDTEALVARIPVVVELEPERLKLMRASSRPVTEAARRRFWDQLIAKGLRAQLKTGNLLTAALYVDLDFYPAAEPSAIAWDTPHPELPTVPTPFDELRGLLTKLARLPVDGMASELADGAAKLSATLDRLSAVLQTLDRQVAPELTPTPKQSQQTLARLEQFVKPGSPLHSDAQQVLRELSAAARSFRIMADYLERHPEALIRGKGGGLR